MRNFPISAGSNFDADFHIRTQISSIFAPESWADDFSCGAVKSKFYAPQHFVILLLQPQIKMLLVFHVNHSFNLVHHFIKIVMLNIVLHRLQDRGHLVAHSCRLLADYQCDTVIIWYWTAHCKVQREHWLIFKTFLFCVLTSVPQSIIMYIITDIGVWWYEAGANFL